MVDPQSEQDQNFRDVLGFDPNSSSEEATGGEGGIPKPKDEHSSWPKDWKEIFKQVRIPIHHNRLNINLLFRDPDNLFGIDEDDYGIDRGYFAFDQSLNSFQRKNYFYVDNDRQSLGVRLESDNHDWSGFNIDPLRKWANASISKMIGGRDLTVYYSDGKFDFVTLEVIPHSRVIDSDKDIIDYGLVRHGNSLSPTVSGLALEGKIDEEKEIAEIQRLEKGKVIDTFSIPLNVDFNKIKEECFPQELLRDPKDPNTALDDSWKGVDFFHEAGLRWDAVADDSLHSLTRLSAEDPASTHIDKA